MFKEVLHQTRGMELAKMLWLKSPNCVYPSLYISLCISVRDSACTCVCVGWGVKGVCKMLWLKAPNCAHLSLCICVSLCV